MIKEELPSQISSQRSLVLFRDTNTRQGALDTDVERKMKTEKGSVPNSGRSSAAALRPLSGWTGMRLECGLGGGPIRNAGYPAPWDLYKELGEGLAQLKFRK